MKTSTDLMGGYTAYATPEGVLRDAAQLDSAMPVTTVEMTITISICTLTLNCP